MRKVTYNDDLHICNLLISSLPHFVRFIQFLFSLNNISTLNDFRKSFFLSFPAKLLCVFKLKWLGGDPDTLNCLVLYFFLFFIFIRFVFSKRHISASMITEKRTDLVAEVWCVFRLTLFAVNLYDALKDYIV